MGLRLRAVLIRLNYDIFRISTDVFVLVIGYALFLHFWIGHVAFAILLCLYLWGSLIYQLYYHVFHKIYHLDPVFFHDFLMLKTGVQIFIHEFSRKNLVMLVAAVFIGAVIAIASYALTGLATEASFGSLSWIASIVLCAGALYSLHYPYSKYPQLTFQSQLQSFIKNLIISKRSRTSVAALTLRYMKQFNVDPSIRMQRRPNVYFIVIESYGRLALEEGALRQQHRQYIDGRENALGQHGWHSCSGYTTSPVMGGASWISYTSMMYGLNVRNQGVYTTMLKNNYMPEYDSLFHWLKRQGYETFRLSSLGGYEKMEIPYESYSRLYGIDHWIKYKDLEYSGVHYGFGPSPPDQYAIWKGDEMATKIIGNNPKAFFFITQNSHTPYESPETVADDWRSLNSGREVRKKESTFWSRPKFEKYGDAIEYQLKFLIDFIINKPTSDDIFILVGDHQPPSLSRTVENFDTPIHIISKDKAFIESWEAYGCVPGMIPDSSIHPIRQEALHWALLRTLIGSYADGQYSLPEFLEKGIPY
jgi:hypothetical protein